MNDFLVWLLCALVLACMFIFGVPEPEWLRAMDAKIAELFPHLK